MVEKIRDVYGLDDEIVLSAMLRVPREEFAPKDSRSIAYEDDPVPIGFGQTMSQPYTVAFMTHLLVDCNSEAGVTKLKLKDQKVLEIGTGSGYQAAILSRIFGKVYTIEIIPQLARRAKEVLKRLGFENVYVKVGDGEKGWKSRRPFDAIIITAAVDDKVVQGLFGQLKAEGILVAPVGRGLTSVMTRYRKLRVSGGYKIQKETFGTFRFVPFI